MRRELTGSQTLIGTDVGAAAKRTQALIKRLA
jgi:hypothetical protein